MKKKYSITLIEIMIVILLIGLIGGALAFNMRGSIDEGKAFKTEQNIMRIKEVLMLEYSKGDLTLEAIQKDFKEIVKNSPYGTGSALLKGGWNEDLSVTIDANKDEFIVSSEKLNAYKTKKESKSQNSG